MSTVFAGPFIAGTDLCAGAYDENISTATVRVGALVSGGDESALANTDFSQDATFAVELGDGYGVPFGGTYASGALVRSIALRPKQRARVLVANGQTLVRGTQLGSNGDGTLSVVAVTDDTQKVLVKSLEATTTSGVTSILVERV